MCFFSRRKPPAEVQHWPPMSTIVRAEQRLREQRDITPPRTAGLLYRHSPDVPYLADLDRGLREALNSGPGATRTNFRLADDPLGGALRWVVLEDAKFDDLTSSVYTAGNAMTANGAKSNLIAAIFLFNFTHGLREGDTRSLLRTYIIYRYDRASWYPFVPTGDKEGDRDRPSELQLARLLGRSGLEVDRSLESWRGLWGIPF
jgi:hypothetical protein